MPPSFAAERTLGKLAKWLRLLGFDAILETELPRGGFPDAAGPERTVLVRSRKLAQMKSVVWIRSNDPLDQLRELAAGRWIARGDFRPFTRCLRCNAPIERVPRAEVQGLVPDYVWEMQAVFSRCPECRRIYWRGSHTQRAMERVERVFGAEGGGW
jgi:hypothetical protein